MHKALKEKDRENKKLEKELHRKEKALAEAAALMILQKRPERSGGTPRTNDQRLRSHNCHRADRPSS